MTTARLHAMPLNEPNAVDARSASRTGLAYGAATVVLDTPRIPDVLAQPVWQCGIHLRQRQPVTRDDPYRLTDDPARLGYVP